MKKSLGYFIAFALGAILFSADLASASTTISTNIQTGGTLSVTATSTLLGDVGILTSSPLAPLQVGNYTANNSSDSQILISRSVDNTVSGNGHGFSDSSNITRSGGIAYNSYDAYVTITGSNNYDHYAGFQPRPEMDGSGTITDVYGLVSLPAFNSGTVTNNYGVDVWDPTGAGTVDNNYGLHVQQLSDGINNWAVYTDGTTPSYFGGTVNIGTTTSLSENLNVSESVGAYANDADGTSYFAAYDEGGNNFVALQKRGTQEPGHIGLSDGAAELLSDGDDFGIYTYTNNYLALGTDDAERLRITNTGNVGIATTTPIANFQVANGNATTTMEIGSAHENKGSCLKLYRTDGSAIYAYIAAGATTFTLTTTACANVSNF